MEGDGEEDAVEATVEDGAEHPDKRFTQKESERVLLQVKGLLEELNKIV